VQGQEIKGNLIITTAMEFPSHEEDIQAIAKSALVALESFFHEMIEAGKALSDIPQSTDTDRAARSLVAMTVGFRVLARGAYDADALRVGKASALSIIGL
jgi:TetR/AcrR family transcriptional repressor of nem operon